MTKERFFRVAGVVTVACALSIIATACGSSSSNSASATKASSGSSDKGTITIALASIEQAGDLPQLIAADTLRREGYQVKFLQLNNNTEATEAVLRGSAQFAEESSLALMDAMSKGADLTLLFQTSHMDYLIAAKNSVSTVQDLNGVTFGEYSTESDTALALAYTLNGHPNIKPKILTGSNSAARVSAMLAGAMDASVIEIPDWVNLQQKGNGKFHILVSYNDAPLLARSTATSTSLAQQDPAMMQDYIKANLAAAQSIKNGGATYVANAIRKYLPNTNPSLIDQIANDYYKGNLWPTDGGSSTVSSYTQTTIKIAVGAGLLPSSATNKSFFDLGPLTKAME